jgi:hypothetical protein
LVHLDVEENNTLFRNVREVLSSTFFRLIGQFLGNDHLISFVLLIYLLFFIFSSRGM